MEDSKEYFKEFHKGEIGDMRNRLLTAISKRNPYLMKSAMEKIISAMTLGMDVSVLFPDVIMVCYFFFWIFFLIWKNCFFKMCFFYDGIRSFLILKGSIANDLVTKKMVYLYIGHYASDNESLALLAMNNFIRDCADDSPMIRGLALRNFTSLRFIWSIILIFRTPSLVEEHILPALKEGLMDVSPYVRKEACIGCAKIFNLTPEFFSSVSYILLIIRSWNY